MWGCQGCPARRPSKGLSLSQGPWAPQERFRGDDMACVGILRDLGVLTLFFCEEGISFSQ